MIRQFIKDQAEKRLIKTYLKVRAKAFTIGQALGSRDPWTLPSLLGFRNWKPIKHERVNLGSTTTPGEDETRVEATIVRDVKDIGLSAMLVKIPFFRGVLGYRVDRHSLDMDAEPLGPEDLECGLRVPPVSEVAEDLQGIWQSAPDLSKTKT